MAAAAQARPPRRRLRAALAWLHLWVGLIAGTAFAVVGLSGTVLTFHEELLLWQQPQLAGHEARADGAVLARILQRWTPQGLGSVQLPQADGLPVWQGYFADGRRGYFAPEDGRLLLLRSADHDGLLWLHELHTDLLGGEIGHQVLGVVGWIALGLLLTGLYLWWPRTGRVLAHLKMHRGPPVRRWLSWHRSGGVLLLPLLLLVTLTGVGMIYHAAARTALTTVFGGGAAPAPPQRAVPTDAPVDWTRVLATAQAALPHAHLLRTAAPASGDDAIGFRARTLGEWHPNGRSLVFVDRAGGEVLLAHDATAQRPGARMTEAIYPLHIGAVGGAWYRWAVALSGLLPAALLVTGFLFWHRRRQVRQQDRAAHGRLP
ncbi:PepSY-associated TM helix domain-containing protein [Luteimonas salinilitoris]|uniref:PepSY-associated TM helix domain-containing protein n=1 Tax=Luteimonas salinilitoris TaxID=3237697 RepID=A0ABV4HUJ6_9GAMM